MCGGANAILISLIPCPFPRSSIIKQLKLQPLTVLFNRATVTDIHRSLSENLKVTGPALISDPAHLEKLVSIVTALITKKHACQQDFGDEEDLDDLGEETSEYDWVVVDTALDVISGLAIALGPTFAELWKIFEKIVLRYAGSSEAVERSAAVGVIAECISGMGPAVTPYTTTLLKLLLHRLSDEDPQTKSNAAYAIGRLIEKSDSNAEIVKAYPTILGKLEAMMQSEKGASRLPDNASGCVSRMIMKHRQSVPVEEVLPALVSLLPLKEDYEENEPIFGMVAELCKCLFPEAY